MGFLALVRLGARNSDIGRSGVTAPPCNARPFSFPCVSFEDERFGGAHNSCIGCSGAAALLLSIYIGVSLIVWFAFLVLWRQCRRGTTFLSLDCVGPARRAFVDH